MARATITQLKAFFETNSVKGKITMNELKELKASRGGKDFDEIMEGIGDGTLTY